MLTKKSSGIFLISKALYKKIVGSVIPVIFTFFCLAALQQQKQNALSDIAS